MHWRPKVSAVNSFRRRTVLNVLEMEDWQYPFNQILIAFWTGRGTTLIISLVDSHDPGQLQIKFAVATYILTRNPFLDNGGLWAVALQIYRKKRGVVGRFRARLRLCMVPYILPQGVNIKCFFSTSTNFHHKCGPFIYPFCNAIENVLSAIS